MHLDVWILNHYAGAPDGQSRAYDIGRRLVRRGHRVTVFASGQNHYTRQDRTEYGEGPYSVEHTEGVRFIWIRAEGRSDRMRGVEMADYALKAYRVGRGLERRPDVVIGSCPHPLAGLAAFRLARRKKARFLYEVRDLWPQTGIDQGLLSPWSPIAIFLARLERFLFERADVLLPVMPGLENYLAHKKIDAKRVQVIPNGVDLEAFGAPGGGTAGVPERERTDPFSLYYVGGHSNYHGLEVLLDAAKILQGSRDDVEIVIVGDGSRKDALVERSEAMALHNVRFLPMVAKDDVPHVLASADATVFTFRELSVLQYGISPLKLFDYMAAAKPVIFAARALNDPVGEAGCGLSIPPDDPRSLAEAIGRLADMSDAERRSMGQRGRRFVETRHSMDHITNMFEEAVR